MNTTVNATDPLDDAVVERLRSALPVTDADLAGLRSRLADGAGEAGLLDVGYRVVDSPVGDLLVAVTDAGVVRVAFESEGHDAVLDRLAQRVGPRVLRSERRTDAVAREIVEYFEGRRRRFDVPVDLRLVSGFRRSVIAHLPDIAYGSTASYAGVARAAGNPAAVRAVGTACGHNPVPIVVPCHRVVRSDGSLGGYLGGPEAKRWLLELEGAA